MNHINVLYNNDLGIAFKWKKDLTKEEDRVQLVFKDNGLYLTETELKYFSAEIKKNYKKANLCNACIKNKECNTLLVQSPCPQISFAMNYIDLIKLKDLVEGTINQVQLKSIFKTLNIQTKS